MSAIHDLIAQVSDPRLRERLSAEWATASQDKKFGLVFEDHLPELLPLYGVKLRRGDLVCRKLGPLKEVWQVRTLRDGVATCIKPQDGAHPDEANASASTPVVFPVDDLLVVREFGEPIFLALVPIDAVANGPADAPWHTLIEADNYHALQLLTYLYEGQVDCIYIDPPYNTGARDWKYNNDYVDSNDSWRHSKWLAFMEKRLKLAKRLLKPDTGVLIVTIDEHEVHHLGMLLESLFPEVFRQLVTIVINQKGVEQGRFARVEEYACYCFFGESAVSEGADDLLSTRLEGVSSQVAASSGPPRWERLQRGGNNATPEARFGLFYPIYIDRIAKRIASVGRPLPKGEMPASDTLGIESIAWPIRRDGSYATWQVGPETLERLIDRGFVRLGGFDKKRQTWTILYLGSKAQQQIASGVLQIVRRDEHLGCVEVAYSNTQQRSLKTVWHRSLHDSGMYGSGLLKSIIGKAGAFSFPKSLYSTRDAVAAVVGCRPQALIVDFFAGSGTTLNAVNLINATDGGQRRCILVTNNEVSAEEAENLRARGLQPSDSDWEAVGICRSVTWPRSKFTIRGQRDDGTALPGDYLTGKSVEREKSRHVTQIGFVDPVTLDTPAKKKQVLALIDGLPQTLVKDLCPFIVSEDHKASILFDTAASGDWLEALADQEHISDFFIVTPIKKLFDGLKEQVVDLLGPLLVSEDEKRPMGAGFAANLAYFKLDFLDKERVALKRAFREILPLLWLKAGAVGARPELPAGAAEPIVFVPEGNNFAVLLDEGRLTKLLQSLSGRSNLSHVFIVTDADESFKAMAAEVLDTLRQENPGLQVVQLYRDYLTNFMINKRQGGTTVAASGAQG
ncbi:MAG: site-specific DNA-methyltransferase [Candidatus Accumulibacter sp.]|uniref:Site-specific DNA-methyltransferase n=1 Tax=Candidatus Accumulibacter affinis TaxID=2954384 RepID=A0A935W6B5_9PROT|nr:site-specific DNA-methyltransferase [Candidatus Accumulibacter affinis]